MFVCTLISVVVRGVYTNRVPDRATSPYWVKPFQISSVTRPYLGLRGQLCLDQFNHQTLSGVAGSDEFSLLSAVVSSGPQPAGSVTGDPCVVMTTQT